MWLNPEVVCGAESSYTIVIVAVVIMDRGKGCEGIGCNLQARASSAAKSVAFLVGVGHGPRTCVVLMLSCVVVMCRTWTAAKYACARKRARCDKLAPPEREGAAEQV